jgi:hypothetical protein
MPAVTKLKSASGRVHATDSSGRALCRQGLYDPATTDDAVTCKRPGCLAAGAHRAAPNMTAPGQTYPLDLDIPAQRGEPRP